MIINLNILDKILIILMCLLAAIGAIAKSYQHEWLFLVSVISIFLLAAVSILQILRTFQKQIRNTGNVIVSGNKDFLRNTRIILAKGEETLNKMDSLLKSKEKISDAMNLALRIEKNMVDRLDSLEKAETDAHTETLNVIDGKYTESSDLLKNQLRTLYDQVDSLFPTFEKIESNMVDRLDSLEKAETDAHTKTLNVINRKYAESSDLLKNQLRTFYDQVDSLFSLFSTLKIRHPLPIMRGWPISPDFANTLISVMLTKRPKNILSLGSGTSDLIIAYCIEKTGSGRLVSLDHDDKFARETQANLEKHQLSKYGQVFYAPLKKHHINNEDWLWYDIDGLIIEDEIDLLIIDGPPAKTQALARYPALPLLNKKLSNNVTIILDDANRTDEKEIIDRWIEEYPELIANKINHETGTCIISLDFSKKIRTT